MPPTATKTAAAKPKSAAAMTPAEKYAADAKAFQDEMSDLAKSVTQKEWLLITRAIDRSRNEIGADQGLTLAALLWVHETRAHGGASWDRVLGMTDQELQDALGGPTPPTDE